MRTPEYVERQTGFRWKVRYRIGGRETAKYFPGTDTGKRNAQTFATLMGDAHDFQIREALDWLARKEAGQASSALTFGVWVERYIDQLTGVTSRTRDDYRVLHVNHLAQFDRVPLDQFSRTHVTDLVNGMEARGLSPKTIKNVFHGLLSPSLALAVDDGLLAKNPTKRVRLPEMKLNDDEDESRFLTYEEYARLDAATDDYYRPLVQFLVGTGLRWSEATALQKRHVDLDAGTIRVLQAWKKIKGGWELGPPKAKKSRRTVNAAATALVALAPLLEGKKSTDTVFLGPQGGFIRHGNFYGRVWVPACVKADLVDPRPRPHDLRHTHASWLISSGVQLEAVQDQLGHESIETTRRVYGHLLPAVGVEVGRVASAAMEKALAGSLANGPADKGILAIEAGS